MIVRNSKIGERTHLGNLVRNKHTKFEQDRSIGSWSNFGGTKSREKEKEEKKKCVLGLKMAYFTISHINQTISNFDMQF